MPVPFDHSFKLLTDDDPRAALAAFANIPLDAEIEDEPAGRELNLANLKVDNFYRCRRKGAEFIIHFEAMSRYRKSALDRQADYVRAIVFKCKLPCRSYMLLLTEGGVPESFPPPYRMRLRRLSGPHSAPPGSALANFRVENSQVGPFGDLPMGPVDEGEPEGNRRRRYRVHRSLERPTPHRRVSQRIPQLTQLSAFRYFETARPQCRPPLVTNAPLAPL